MKALFALLLLTTTLFSNEPRVLLFSGSTRKASTNKKLIHEAARIAESEGATVQVIDLGIAPIPYYDGDIESEFGMPQSARELREALMESQVVIISTPNYNASIPGILKNALDWTSRSLEGKFSREAFDGKTFVLFSASTSKSGGKSGCEHLKAIIEKLNGSVFSETLAVGRAHEAFDEEGRLKDPKMEAKLKKILSEAIGKKSIIQERADSARGAHQIGFILKAIQSNFFSNEEGIFLNMADEFGEKGG